MKKTEKVLRLILGSLFMASALVFTGCSEDPVVDNGDGTENSSDKPGGSEGTLTFKLVSETKEDTPFLLISGGEISLEYKVENAETVTVKDTPAGWEINVDLETSTVKVKALIDEENASFDLVLVAKGMDGTEKEIKVPFSKINNISFDDPRGAFVLSEGNMTTENGSLDYITPDGQIINDVYKQVNGSELGNVCQDMAFHDGKIYIISQNGDTNPEGTSFENDGMLVILDAKTLKKIKSFSKEDLSELYWPTHIAVLDDNHIYIRDNKDSKGAIWRFDSETGVVTFVQGSDGAPQTPFVVKDGKVYTFINDSIFIKLWSIDPANDKVNETYLPSYLKEACQIQDAGDNNMWVLARNSDTKTWIMKVDLSKTSDRNTPYKVLNTLPSPHGNASGKRFATYGNTIYYNDDTYLYSLDFEVENAEPKVLVDLYELDDTAIELYNGISVNPATGHLYVNTIKGVGPAFTTNSIWAFNVNGSWTSPVYKFENYTRFPAGTFFYPIN